MDLRKHKRLPEIVTDPKAKKRPLQSQRPNKTLNPGASKHNVGDDGRAHRQAIQGPVGCSEGAKVKGFVETETARFVTSSFTATATVGPRNGVAANALFSCFMGRLVSPIAINNYPIDLRLSGLDDSSFGLPTYFTLWLDAFVARAVILEL